MMRMAPLRGSEGCLDAVIAHAEGVLDDDPGDRIALQELDEIFVRAEGDDDDLIASLLGYGLGHGLRCDRIRNKNAAQVALLAMRSFMISRTPAGVPSATLSAAMFSARYFAATTSLKPLARCSREPTPGTEVMTAMSPSVSAKGLCDRCCESICGDATRIHIIGRQERGHSLGIGRGFEADDLDFLGGFINRLLTHRIFSREMMEEHVSVGRRGLSSRPTADR